MKSLQQLCLEYVKQNDATLKAYTDYLEKNEKSVDPLELIQFHQDYTDQRFEITGTIPSEEHFAKLRYNARKWPHINFPSSDNCFGQTFYGYIQEHNKEKCKCLNWPADPGKIIIIITF
jgi:hypothetical protein